MKRSGRFQRVLACTGAMAVLGTLPLLLLAEPAQAVWPATIIICNHSESEDTNGGSTDGKNIDVDRLPGSSYGTYSNELLPGECTGNVNDPANVRIDLTDDGAQTTATGLLSAAIGVDADGIDDTQGPHDPACYNTSAISTEAALPLPQTATENVLSGSGLKVKIQKVGLCGAADPLYGRVCSDAASFDDFDAEGLGTSTWNNNLAPGECTAFMPIAATVSGQTTHENNPNRLTVDLSNDFEHEMLGLKWKDNYLNTSYSACTQIFGSEVGGNAGTGWDIPLQFDSSGNLVAGKTATVRIFPGVPEPDEGICGEESPLNDIYPVESAYGIPTEDPADPEGDVGDEIDGTADDFPESQATYPHQTATTMPQTEPDGSL